MTKNLMILKKLVSEHHFSHAASAFYPSPFDEAVILTLDGVGEWATSTLAIGKNNKISMIKKFIFLIQSVYCIQHLLITQVLK